MIRQETPREALHLAQVLQMALRSGPQGPPGPHPERGYPAVLPAGFPTGLLGAGLLVAGAWWYAAHRKGNTHAKHR